MKNFILTTKDQETILIALHSRKKELLLIKAIYWTKIIKDEYCNIYNIIDKLTEDN